MLEPKLALAGLAVILANVSINIGAAFAKTLFPVIGPEGVALFRTVVSVLLLMPIAQPWKLTFTPSQIRVLFFYGLTLGAMNLLIYWAFARIPIGVAVAIEISGPLAIVLLTSRSLLDFLWFLLAVASLALLIPWPGNASDLDLVGVLCALGAAIGWALYILLGKRAAEVKSSAAVACGMAAACLVTVPFGVATAGTDLLLGSVIGLGCVVAILSSALPYVLEMKALEILSSRMFGVITSSTPAIAALAGFAILGERLTSTQWLAVALMIGASAGCTLTSKPARSGPADEAMV